ncbi:Mucin-associated surface protein (MASP) [Trypanosoma cruzi]|uniref:Mucin-associated surface protein (MASP), putative n=2 Tax=Trypanosoma cruzi TaxID=5693 RepID=Q4DZ46_TRYCC|nr:mucin-associated surface protein (MASP), putative [Trypanosoma cruzi]EAN97803.1 mucin-associated surface protein (MASP), putative [Trypanosoma cruzi]PWV05399.1 Mucin-associated surface protein (MASP) [Trypanosoma cruzi]|eukprot:XP_819654.1 mucin-associated surface protein (MASP) [Trypanosoma cruzi strain CL Brener]
MAMMVTGRVLLVCALCVLWCGAVFGHATEDYCGEGGGNGLRHTSNGGDDGVSLKTDCGLLSSRMGLIKAVEASDAGPELSVVPEQVEKSQDTENSSKDKTSRSGASVPDGDGFAGQPAPPKPGESGPGGQERESGVLDPNVRKEAEERNGSLSESQKLRTDQSSTTGGPGTEDSEEPALEDTSERNGSSNIHLNEEDAGEAEVQEISEPEEPEKDKSNMALTETHDSQAKQKEAQLPTPPTLPTTQVDEHSSPGDTVAKQQLQKPQSEMGPNENSQSTSVATITANQHNEPSADHAGSRPPSPTANGDAANHEADKTTEDGIPNNDPAADGAETREGKRNENKEANPKETPVDVTAMKTTTAKAGDSDGSSAVSHTTSPLLLLLLGVACAAAAAVVAA